MKLFIIIIIENDIDEENIKNIWLIEHENIQYKFTKKSIFEIIKEDILDFNFICTNQSYVNVLNLYNYLLNFNSNDPLYIGGHGDFRKLDIPFFFHSPTPGIILSKEACNIINENINLLNYNNLCLEYNKDLINCYGVAIGYFCHLNKINLINCDHIHYCNWNGHPCHINKINKTKLISCSNMNFNDMKIFNNYLNKKRIIICPSGGLGNILFQYFLGYTLEKEYNYNA